MKYVPALGFARLTPLFDPLIAAFGFGPGRRAQVVRLLALRPRERLLDVGCGTGTFLLAAKRRHPDVRAVGLDVDRPALAIARRKVRRTGLALALVNASADALPFAAGRFDAVASTLTFHHLPTDVKRRALGEVHRVIGPNGRFLLADFGRAHGAPMRHFVWLVRALRLPEAATLRDNVEGRLPGLLDAAGFDARSVASRYRGIDFLLARRRPAAAPPSTAAASGA